jgi:hypothetical protein
MLKYKADNTKKIGEIKGKKCRMKNFFSLFSTQSSVNKNPHILNNHNK